MPFFYEDDADNPSGEIERVKRNNPDAEKWEIKEIKPSSPRNDKEEQRANCSHCGKLFGGEIKYRCDSCRTVYCSKNCCETSAPQCKSRLDQHKNSEKTPDKVNPSTPIEQNSDKSDRKEKPVKFVVNYENKNDNTKKLPDKTDNQTLVISLSDIKQMTLTSEGNLVIEFNPSQSEPQANSVQ
ncbi:11888_t:CDS:2, partial [Funneliformis geosporum]